MRVHALEVSILMTIFLRLLLIAALLWALLRLVRHLVFGPPSASRVGASRTDAGSRPSEGRSESKSSESLVSCEVCGLRVPESESRKVLLPDGEHRVCSENCRQRLQA